MSNRGCSYAGMSSALRVPETDIAEAGYTESSHVITYSRTIMGIKKKLKIFYGLYELFA